MNILHIPLSTMEVNDLGLPNLANIEAFKLSVEDKVREEKTKIGESILATIKTIILNKINSVDDISGISNREMTTMSTAPSFVTNHEQPDVNRFVTTIRLSDHVKYFNLMYNAFNIETLVEIHYKSVLTDNDFHGVPPFECSYRETEESNLRLVNLTLNIHEGDLSQIERSIDVILDGIHDIFYTIFADISEDYNYALNNVTQTNFNLLLKKLTGKDDPSEVDSEEKVQEIYYLTLLLQAVRFYRAREAYDKILGMQVEPQIITNTRKTLGMVL